MFDLGNIMNSFSALGAMGSSGAGTGSWEPNVLSQYDQVAYHLKFMVADDMTAIQVQGGNLGALQGATIIAETGASVLNITELELRNHVAPNYSTKNNNLLGATMKITEPMGATLLDRLSNASSLGVSNWLKCIYFLQVKFHGYDQNGQYVDMIGDKMWTYSMKLADMKFDIDAGGAKYVLDLVGYDDHALTGHFNYLGKGFATAVTTVGEFYAKLKEFLEVQQQVEYGRVRHIFNFNIHPVKTEFGTMPIAEPPSSWLIQSLHPDLQSSRATSQQGLMLETHIGTNLGDTMSTLTNMIFSGTNEAQQLATRSFDPTMPSNKAENAVTWKIVAETKIRPDNRYDVLDESYNYNITYHIIPHVSTNGMLSIDQRNDAENQGIVNTKLQRLSALGRLKKEYQYIFTGLNTEVVDFQIQSQLSHIFLTPRDGGDFDNSASTPELMSEWQETVQQTPDIRNAERMQQLLTSENFGILPSTIQDTMRAAFDGMMVGLQGSGTAGVGPGTFIDDVPKNQAVLIPQTFDRETVKTLQNESGDVESDIQPGQRNFFMYLNQVLQVSPVFMALDLSIRGDPYWMGNSTLTEPLGSPQPTQNFDGVWADNNILIQFYIPMGVDPDSGAPILDKSNLYSGLYMVTQVNNIFTNGKFTQMLIGSKNTNAILRG